MHGTTLGVLSLHLLTGPQAVLQAMALVRQARAKGILLLYNGCRSECQGLSRKEKLRSIKKHF